MLKIQLQTSKNITSDSVQAPILGKRILLADKSDNHVLYHIASQIWQLLQHYGFISIGQGQCKFKYFSLSFLEEAAKKLHIVLQCIYRHDFLSPHTTIALGVKNYPSACMSSCFDELLPYSLSSKKMSVSSIRRLTHKIASFLSLISTHSVNNFNNV